jgi:hypothetical protein
MAAVLRASAPSKWLSVNVARMIVLVQVRASDGGGTAVTACSRPELDCRVFPN